MKDYIKELNIIDFLGIIVPGTLLVLLITGNNTDLLLWEDYFGAEATAWIKGIFLLIAGYLAGMLLHEIGDCLEKGVWCFHVLDPKAYAANAVDAQKIEDALVNATLLDKELSSQSFTYVIHPVIKGILGIFTTVLLLFLSTVGFCFAMNSACHAVDSSLAHAIDANVYWVVSGLLVAGICVLLVLAIFLWRKYTHESKFHKEVRVALKKIRKLQRKRKIYSGRFISVSNHIIEVLSSVLSNSNPSSLDALNWDRKRILELLDAQTCNNDDYKRIWNRLNIILARHINPIDTLSDVDKHTQKTSGGLQSTTYASVIH